MEKGRKSAKRIVAVLLTAALMVGGIAGGTYAWLISKTDEVVNTFSYGDINIEKADGGHSVWYFNESGNKSSSMLRIS